MDLDDRCGMVCKLTCLFDFNVFVVVQLQAAYVKETNFEIQKSSHLEVFCKKVFLEIS